jgi:hypothetical protein
MGGVVVRRATLSVERGAAVAARWPVRAGPRLTGTLVLAVAVAVLHLWLLDVAAPGVSPAGVDRASGREVVTLVAPAALATSPMQPAPAGDVLAAAARDAVQATQAPHRTGPPHDTTARAPHRAARRSAIGRSADAPLPAAPSAGPAPGAAVELSARTDAAAYRSTVTAATPGGSTAGLSSQPESALAAAATTVAVEAAPAREPPLYATAPPAPRALHYLWQRGTASGQARLDWRPQGDRYELDLQAHTADEPAWHQSSRGRLDETGLVPERFVDQRRRRGAQAANFRHGQGRITYSSSSAEQPLPRAAQDRLSWLVQLAALAQAADAGLEPGVTRELYVSGVRADAGTWIFEVIGTEAIDTASGALAALRLERRATRAYDTQATVWLAPALQHLPVRVVLQHPPGPDRLELHWRP